MKSTFTLLFVLFISAIGLKAQQYYFQGSTTPYQPFTDGTVITLPGWNNNIHPINMGFNFVYFGQSFSEINVVEDGWVYFTPTGQELILFMAADLGERASATPSLIRYKTTGSAPFRTFHLQFENAGFIAGVAADSANFTFRIFETSNIFEIAYGSSHITDYTDIFSLDGPVIYFNNFTATIEYTLTGDPAYPTFSNLQASLDTMPASGTVYSFSPTTFTSVEDKGSAQPSIDLFPNPANTTANLVLNTVENAHIKIELFDVTGKLMQTIKNSTLDKGNHQFTISTADLSSGIYFINLEAGDYKEVKRLNVIR